MIELKELKKHLEGVKLILMDLDGTALQPNGNLSTRLTDTLQKLETGVRYTFISARAPQMMQRFCAQVKITVPVVSLDGALIKDWNSDEIFCQKKIEKQTAIAAMSICHDLGLDYTFYTVKNGYFRYRSRRLEAFNRENHIAVAMGLPPLELRYYEDVSPEHIADEGILKIYLETRNLHEQEKARELLCQLPLLHMNCSEGTSLSAMDRQVSKAKAAKTLCSFLHIGLEELCVFGDYYNDMDLLRVAGCSVAMGNAPEAVKRCAYYVTESNTNDGVADFIERFIL